MRPDRSRPESVRPQVEPLSETKVVHAVGSGALSRKEEEEEVMIVESAGEDKEEAIIAKGKPAPQEPTGEEVEEHLVVQLQDEVLNQMQQYEKTASTKCKRGFLYQVGFVLVE